MVGYNIVELDHLLEELEEDSVKSILLSFVCPLNKDVEVFLNNKAIEFSKQGLAKTHLIFTSFKDKPVLIGYYALANKVIMVKEKALSKSLEKRIKKLATKSHELKSYYISAPLIAQLGKNFKDGFNKLITGDELLKLACDQVAKVHSVIGGKIVYLESEDVEGLICFYSRNGFVNFGQRPLDKDETDLKGEYLIQMLKYL